MINVISSAVAAYRYSTAWCLFCSYAAWVAEMTHGFRR